MLGTVGLYHIVQAPGVLAAVTALLLHFVIWRIWQRPVWLATLVVLPFLLLDATFLWANAQKLADGGWVSVAIAAGLTVVMLT